MPLLVKLTITEANVAGKKGMHDKWRFNGRAAETFRDRIDSSRILNCLAKHITGESEMSATQVTAAIALLRKTMPDLAASEVTVHKESVSDVLKQIAERKQRQNAPGLTEANATQVQAMPVSDDQLDASNAIVTH